MFFKNFLSLLHVALVICRLYDAWVVEQCLFHVFVFTFFTGQCPD